MTIHTLFPTRVQQNRLLPANAPLHRHLLKECYQFQKLDEAGQRWSKKNYLGGYTSYGSMTNMNQRSPFFHELSKKIDKEVKNFAGLLEMDVRSGDLQMCSLWFNIMPANVSHTMHLHPHSVISGTYYLQMPLGARGLKLEDPRLLGYMATPPRKAKAKLENQWFVELKASAGEILLFESWLKHEVPPGKGKGDRVSVSFNYNWV
jgi:uncharacterized protein (TIGR02466 family)